MKFLAELWERVRPAFMASVKEAKIVARWLRGEQTVSYLMDRGRLESFEASDLPALADAQIRRAMLRLNATAASALEKGSASPCRM